MRTRPFDDLARAFLARCFGHQTSDGGLPETFPGTPPGYWTSSEVYAAICEFELYDLCPVGAVDALERWLIRGQQTLGGRGLCHYPAGPGARCIVEASAALVIGLRARHVHPEIVASVQAWLLVAQAADGGWGISEGEPGRVYSTAYAIMALDPITHADARRRGSRWLTDCRLPDGAWPFRPAVTTSSCTTTQLAASALGMRPADPTSDVVRRHLLQGAEGTSLLEEDEMPTTSGWKMSYSYAPRLVCLGGGLTLSEGRIDDPVLARLLRALATYEVRARRIGRPGVDSSDERLWHYIEFAWGYGLVRSALSRLGGAIQARLADYVALRQTEIDRSTVLDSVAPPLAALVARLWNEDETAAERLTTLSALAETTCRIVRAHAAAELIAFPEHRHLALAAVRESPAGAGHNLWSLTAKLARVSPSNPVACELAESRQLLQRWLKRRNDHAHRPASTPAGRSQAVLLWDRDTTEVLRRLGVLRRGLCTVDEVGLPSGIPVYRYRVRDWIGRGSRVREGYLETFRRLPDRLGHVSDQAEAVAREVRLVYTGSADGESSPLRLLSPFVFRAACPTCRHQHFFLLDGQTEVLGPHACRLTLTAGECGTELSVEWSDGAVLSD